MMLLTHAYVVPRDKEDHHARLARRLAEVMKGLGAEMEVYEQVTSEFEPTAATSARFVQIIRFRDRRHFEQVQAAEKTSSIAQALIAELCDLVDMPGQQSRGTYLPGTYSSVT